MYTLRKLQLEEGKDSLLPTGYTTKGEKLNLFDWETHKRKDIDNLNSVVVGWQVVLTSSLRDYHRTSKIREIVKREPNRVVFKTQTSVYELLEEKV